MNRSRKRIFIAIALAAFAAIATWFVHATFFSGRSSGPDFIEAIASGGIAADAISSVEVVEPTVGYMPFTKEEYDKLSIRRRIDSPAELRRLLSLLPTFQPGSIAQNHPATTYRAFLKANARNEFFWLYCKVLEDRTGPVLIIEANKRNATNPNAAHTYHLKEFSEVLGTIIGTNKPVQRTGASRSAQTRTQGHRRLAPVADLFVPRVPYERTIYNLFTNS